MTKKAQIVLRNRLQRPRRPRLSVQQQVLVDQGQQLNIPFTVKGGVPPYFYALSGEHASLADIQTGAIRWVNAAVMAPGNYALELTVTDTRGRSDGLNIAVTVVPAQIPLPGALQNADVIILSSSTARLQFDPEPNSVSYGLQINDQIAVAVPADRRVRQLPGNTVHVFKLWGIDSLGRAGPVSTFTRTTQSAGLPADDQILTTRFSEPDAAAFDFTLTDVPQGAAGLQVHLDIFSYAGTAHRHMNVTLGGQTAVAIVGNDTAIQAAVSQFRVPWTNTGFAAAPVLHVECKAADGTTNVTVARMEVRPRLMKNRPLVPISSVQDTSAPAEQTVAVQPEQYVAVASSAIANEDLVPDLVGVEPEGVEGYNVNLNSVSGQYVAPDAGSRLVGAAWVNPLTGVVPGNQKMAITVYDKPTPPPGGVGVQAMWSDDLAASYAVCSHINWHAGAGDGNGTHHWEPGDAAPRVANFIDLFLELGARKIRSGVGAMSKTGYSGQEWRYMNALYNGGGVQLFGPVGNEDTAISAYQNMLTTALQTMNGDGKRRLIGLEGVNEPNHPGHAANWASDTKAKQTRIWQLIKGGGGFTALDTTMLVMGPSCWGRLTLDYLEMAGLDMQSVMECQALHFYGGGRKPTILGKPDGSNENGSSNTYDLEDAFKEAQAGWPSINRAWVTESDYCSANPQGIRGWLHPSKAYSATQPSPPYPKGTPRPMCNGTTITTDCNEPDPNWLSHQHRSNWNMAYDGWNISSYSMCKYTPRNFIEMMSKGKPHGIEVVAKYNWSDDVDTRPNKCWGFTLPNRAETLLVPRPHFYSVKRLLALLSDSTWNGTTRVGARPSSLGFLNWTITGGNADTGPKVPGQSQPGFLLQKRDGKFLLILYQDEESYRLSGPFPTPNPVTNLKTAMDLDPTPRAVTINFGRTFNTIREFRPAFRTDGSMGDETPTPVQTWTGARTSLAVNLRDHLSIFELS